MNKRWFSSWMVSAVLLAACGGGGGGGTPEGGGSPLPVSTFNMQAALASTLAQGATPAPVRGTVGNDTVEVTLTYAPAADGVFEGQTYKRATERAITRVNGAVLDDTSSTLYYVPPASVMVSTSGPDLVTRMSHDGALPTAGTIGASGPYLHSSTTLNMGGTTIPLGDTVATWSLEPDTGATAWACLTATPVEDPSTWQKTCWRIDPAGVVSGLRITMMIQGQPLTLQ